MLADMSLVRVYRVEGPDGAGPYNSGLLKDEDPLGRWMKDIPYSGDSHQPPQYDGISLMREEELCGFASMLDVVAWFGHKTLALLRTRGFDLWGFTVPEEDVKYGGMQLVFDPRGAVQKVRL